MNDWVYSELVHVGQLPFPPWRITLRALWRSYEWIDSKNRRQKQGLDARGGREPNMRDAREGDLDASKGFGCREGDLDARCGREGLDARSRVCMRDARVGFKTSP